MGKRWGDLFDTSAHGALPLMTDDFIAQLELRAGKKLKVRINDNRQTMLSVHWEPDHTRASIHRMFLMAPKNVMDELACYLAKPSKRLSPTVRSFIEEGVRQLDYSHKLDDRRLITQGTFYDLKEIYRDVNAEYFDNRLNLKITWYGECTRRRKRRITFGQYEESLKLIKVHRLLDNPSIPEYLLAFIVYHEMLHHVCPAYVDEAGIHRIHSKEFKEKERQFRHYALATAWVTEHKENLFRGKIGLSYGRTQQVGKHQTPERAGRRKKRQSFFSGG